MGKLIHEYNVIAFQSIRSRSTALLMEERRDLLLTILPKYTVLKEIEEFQSPNCSTNYIFIFDHPYFEDGTKIELEFETIAWRNPDLTQNPYMEGSILKNVQYTPFSPKQKLFPFCN